VSVKRRLGVGVGVSCFFIYFNFLFFCDLFGNRFLLVEKGIVYTVLSCLVSLWFVLCHFWFPKWNFIFYLFCFIFDFPDESLIFKVCPFDFSKEFLISKKYLRLISQPVSVRRRLRTRGKMQTKGGANPLWHRYHCMQNLEPKRETSLRQGSFDLSDIPSSTCPQDCRTAPATKAISAYFSWFSWAYGPN